LRDIVTNVAAVPVQKVPSEKVSNVFSSIKASRKHYKKVLATKQLPELEKFLSNIDFRQVSDFQVLPHRQYVLFQQSKLSKTFQQLPPTTSISISTPPATNLRTSPSEITIFCSARRFALVFQKAWFITQLFHYDLFIFLLDSYTIAWSIVVIASIPTSFE
jgi:hypothetical protein